MLHTVDVVLLVGAALALALAAAGVQSQINLGWLGMLLWELTLLLVALGPGGK